MKIARVYHRVSSDLDEGRQDFALQDAACAAFCTVHNYSVAQTYTDDGYSRSTDPGDRPGFCRLMDDLQSGEVIVVYDRDRLGEGLKLAALEKDLEDDFGVCVVSTKGCNDRTLEGKLMRGILDLFSEYEHGKIRRRIKDKLAAKKANGEVYCGRVYGYADVGGKLVECREEQRAVEFMREMREGGHSLSAISESLTLRGYAAPGGGRWHKSTVMRILERTGT